MTCPLSALSKLWLDSGIQVGNQFDQRTTVCHVILTAPHARGKTTRYNHLAELGAAHAYSSGGPDAGVRTGIDKSKDLQWDVQYSTFTNYC